MPQKPEEKSKENLEKKIDLDFKELKNHLFQRPPQDVSLTALANEIEYNACCQTLYSLIPSNPDSSAFRKALQNRQQALHQEIRSRQDQYEPGHQREKY